MMPPMASFSNSSTNPTPTTAGASSPFTTASGGAVAGHKRSIEKTSLAASGSSKRRAKARGNFCNYIDCTKLAKTGGFCIAHGGGRRCKFPGGCKSSDQGHGFCKKHGGGKRCQIVGCSKSDVGFGRCTLHGGGHRCDFIHENGVCCSKSDQGGKRGEKNQHRRCKAHGGGRRCTHENNCARSDAGGGLCRRHGGGRRSTKAVADIITFNDDSAVSVASSSDVSSSAVTTRTVSPTHFNLSEGVTGGMSTSSALFQAMPTNPQLLSRKFADEHPNRFSFSQIPTSSVHNFNNLLRILPLLSPTPRVNQSVSQFSSGFQGMQQFAHRAMVSPTYPPLLNETANSLAMLQLELNQVADQVCHRTATQYPQEPLASEYNNQQLLRQLRDHAMPMSMSHSQSLSPSNVFNSSARISGTTSSLPSHLNLGLGRNVNLENANTSFLHRQSQEVAVLQSLRRTMEAASRHL